MGRRVRLLSSYPAVVVALFLLVSCKEGGSAPSSMLQEHPRIFFSKSELPAIRQKAQGTHASICEQVLAFADSALNETPPAYPGQSGLYSTAFKQPLMLAFAYVITGDTKYSAKARDFLLDYASWPTWGDDTATTERDYPMAYMVIGSALAYDWIYDQLSDSDRATIRAAIGAHLQELYEASNAYHAEWSNWWWKSYVQNHWTQCLAGLGTGSLVLEGEDPRTAEWLSHAVTQLERSQTIYEGIRDGTWHEGPHYQHSGQFVLVLPFLWNLERLKQQSLFADEYFQNYLTFSVYDYLPDTLYPVLTYSSYVPGWGGQAVSGTFTFPRAFAARYKDGHGEWVTQNLLKTVKRGTYHAFSYVFEFFYYDPSVAPVPPDDLPTRRVFSDLGLVIWRTGWGSEDLTFGFKSGPYAGRYTETAHFQEVYPFEESNHELNIGHDHQDAGTFYLYRGGRDLASEMADRHDNALGATVHNVLRVDGKGQYKANWDNRFFQDTDGKLDVVAGAGDSDYLRADLLNRYREVNSDAAGTAGAWMLTGYKRHVLFARPDYLLMVDDLHSDTVHQYEWISHFSESPKATISVSADWIKAIENTSQGDVLGVKILAPASFVTETGLSEHPYSGSPPATKPYVRLRPSSDTADGRFILLLLPTTASAWDSRPEASLLESTENVVAVRVNKDGTQDHLIRCSNASSVAAGDYSLAGQAASVYINSLSAIQRLFLVQGQQLADQTGTHSLIEITGGPATVEAVFQGSSLTLNTEEGFQSLQIYAPNTATDQVTANGATVSATRSGDYLTVGPVSAGPRIAVP